MKPTVLLIDNEEDFLIPMTFFLRQNAFDVIALSSINEARDYIKGIGERIDVILLDINFHSTDTEDMSGLQFFEELTGYKCPPIIVVTQYTDIDIITKIARRRPYYILSKGQFSIKEGKWIATINKAVQSRWASAYQTAKTVDAFLTQNPPDIDKAIKGLVTFYNDNNDTKDVSFKWHEEKDKTARYTNSYRQRIQGLSDALFAMVMEQERGKDA